MACGVTKSENGVTVTCDNAGSSSHLGSHSGTLPSLFSFGGRSWATSTRVYWKASAATIAKQKAAVLGESDLI